MLSIPGAADAGGGAGMRSVQLVSRHKARARALAGKLSALCMSAISSDAPEPGSSSDVLNQRYRLLATIAAGGMATVYKAQDLLLHRIVAVKILRSRYARDPLFVRRFRDEAASAAGLNHPNIVTIFDVGRDMLDGRERHYIVMEFVDGADLRQFARQNSIAGVLPVDDALHLMLQVCGGVAYAHKRGLVHCDLKPQNVVVANNGRAKITDFGIARAYTVTIGAAREDVVWGTPQYFAPEQAAGEAPTPSSDVYSLGVLAFELLCGRLPFVATDPAVLAMQHQSAPPPSLSALNPAVSLQLEGIVTRALAKDPAQRYRNADHFATVLADYLQHGEQDTLLSLPPAAPAVPVVKPPVAVDVSSVAERVQARRGLNPPRRAAASAETTDNSAAVAPARGEVAGAARHEERGRLSGGVVALGVLAVVCVLGLIPLYWFVYAEYTKPPTQSAVTPSGVTVIVPTAPQIVILVSVVPPTIAVTDTPLPAVELPPNLIGRELDDALRGWFTSRGLTVEVRSAYSLDPAGTILAVEPAGSSAVAGSVLTFTLSSGGRIPLNAQLDGAVLIESAQFTRDEYAPGMSVQFDVTWRALRAVGKDYRVFVHLYDAAGNFLGQTGDRAPADKGVTYPTAAWKAGTIVVDTYALQIPLDAQPGQYEIRVGLYDDGGRLEVTNAGMAVVKLGGVVAGTVRVR